MQLEIKVWWPKFLNRSPVGGPVFSPEYSTLLKEKCFLFFTERRCRMRADRVEQFDEPNRWSACWPWITYFGICNLSFVFWKGAFFNRVYMLLTNHNKWQIDALLPYYLVNRIWSLQITKLVHFLLLNLHLFQLRYWESFCKGGTCIFYI